MQSIATGRTAFQSHEQLIVGCLKTATDDGCAKKVLTDARSPRGLLQETDGQHEFTGESFETLRGVGAMMEKQSVKARGVPAAIHITRAYGVSIA